MTGFTPPAPDIPPNPPVHPPAPEAPDSPPAPAPLSALHAGNLVARRTVEPADTAPTTDPADIRPLLGGQSLTRFRAAAGATASPGEVSETAGQTAGEPVTAAEEPAADHTATPEAIPPTDETRQQLAAAQAALNEISPRIDIRSVDVQRQIGPDPADQIKLHCSDSTMHMPGDPTAEPMHHVSYIIVEGGQRTDVGYHDLPEGPAKEAFHNRLDGITSEIADSEARRWMQSAYLSEARRGEERDIPSAGELVDSAPVPPNVYQKYFTAIHFNNGFTIDGVWHEGESIPEDSGDTQAAIHLRDTDTSYNYARFADGSETIDILRTGDPEVPFDDRLTRATDDSMRQFTEALEQTLASGRYGEKPQQTTEG